MNECIRSYPRNDMTWQAMTRCYLSVAESLGAGQCDWWYAGAGGGGGGATQHLTQPGNNSCYHTGNFLRRNNWERGEGR